MDQFFCMLYIDTDEEIGVVDDVVQGFGEDLFPGINVSLIVYRNEDFDPSYLDRSPYAFIEASRYYAEVSAPDELVEQSVAFQLGVVKLVRLLRGGRRFVTVSCDFEDLIINETGWNWTKSQPEPPGRR